jgi:hypothetical protein
MLDNNYTIAILSQSVPILVPGDGCHNQLSPSSILLDVKLVFNTVIHLDLITISVLEIQVDAE